MLDPRRESTYSQDMADFKIFRTILYYCIIIIALPVVTFFGTKVFFFEGLMGLSLIPSNVYSAISAVAALHIALGLYIYRAYSESKPDAGKQD